jgi:propanol-preferring alcohol dehydrogenase
MKAAQLRSYGAPLTVDDAPDPKIGADDVLVRVEASGVCATDLKVMAGGLGADPNRLPLIPGHEIAGTIQAVGTDVTTMTVGDRVAVHALFSCGTCDMCLAGEEEACPQGIPNLAGVGVPGGYAELIRVPADHVLPLPAELSPVEAAPLLCAGLTVFAALKNAHLTPGQRVAVLGIGGLGHLAIPIARAMGAEVVAVTSSEDKADAARSLGAGDVVSGEDAGAQLRASGGVDVVLNTVDAPEPIMSVLGGMRPQSALVLVTTSVGDLLPIPTPVLMGLQMRVVTSFFGSREDLRELLDLAVAHHIRPIVETYALADVNTAHDRLRSNDVRFRAVLTP